jgi:hypothetical protein
MFLDLKIIRIFFYRHTRHDLPAEYLRFKAANQTFRSGHSEGITYKEYNSNAFIVGFDLATSELDDVNSQINSVQTSANTRITVDFSGQTPHEITMIVYAVYTNALQIDGNHKVTNSYVNNIN